MIEGSDAPRTNARLRYLDGLRGLAVTLVVAWHYTDETYAEHLPYGAGYAKLPGIDHGWIGVDLFFLISGYVIFLTLERCNGFRDFITRRWLRLFPAMLVATCAVLLMSRFNYEHMPHGRPPLINALPGLTFISPGLWQYVAPIDELDGVYWTLYVEVGFYLTGGLLFFALGWKRCLVLLSALWLGTYVLARTEWQDLQSLLKVFQFLGAEYFGWFVSGALFYKASETKSHNLFCLAVFVGLAASQTADLWQPGDLVARLYLAGTVLFFAAVQKLKRLRSALDGRALLAFGFASYPMYLLHNELGIGLISRLGAATNTGVASALVVALTLFAVSYVVAARVEPWLRKHLASLVSGTPPRQLSPPAGSSTHNR